MLQGTPIELFRLHTSSRGLDEQELHAIVEHAELAHYQAGEVVHCAEEPSNNLILVMHGRLKMSAVLHDGSERTIQYLVRGDQFGLLGLLEDKAYPFKVEADENATVLNIAREYAIKLFHEQSLWARNLMRSIGPKIRSKLFERKRYRRPRTVALIHTDDSTRSITSQITQRLLGLEESVGILSDHTELFDKTSADSSSLLDSNNRFIEPEKIRQLVSQWTDRNRILFDIKADNISDKLTALTGACDAIFWICTPNSVNILKKHLKPMIQSSPVIKDRTFIIWNLDSAQSVGPQVPELSDWCKQDFKVHSTNHPDSMSYTHRSGLERVIHSLRGISIGVALGGGAARGMAHLGVLQVLEEEGIVIDRMSGTSAGALAGVNYAAGYSPGFLTDAFATDLQPAWYHKMLPYSDGLYLLDKFRRGSWDKMLRKYLHSWKLEQLPIPISSVAVDLVQAAEVIRDKGDAAQAIAESINLPFLSRPICRDGMTLVDGGILNVVPADILVNQGSNIIIAVDVAARIRFEFVGNKPGMKTSEMKTPNSFQTAVRMRTVQDRNTRSMGGNSADLTIEPDVSEVDLADFKSAHEIADIGRTAAIESLPNLKQILKSVDRKLFAF